MPAIPATTGLEMRRKTAWPGVLSTKLPSDQGPRRGGGRGCGGSTGGLASICSTLLEEPVAFQELRFIPAGPKPRSFIGAGFYALSFVVRSEA
ncbi:hypothetical protein CSOJ01_02599 [Colletotrichum sojae]|uniref:Uncharacterized protein n=1 Tax=Colletotrichum sojae TaxID=2175907 RepID=A0A8H6JPV5_9PEZI|nr:hypothetical protein CSOJ01_02599 [Colletotrichum sojae]